MILRICLCIPSYNNPETIQKVVSDCIKQTSFSILVVDDGSDLPIQNLLINSTCEVAFRQGRLRILRLPKNQGKGIALQMAIQDCVKNGFTHLFSIDGDGQHLVSEVRKLVDTSLLHPWDLVIGNRKLDSATVPGSSKFGRRFSNFWVNYQTGTPIVDSQSGFRIYPLFHIQNMKFWTKRYDFEIEVLIRLLWKGVEAREVEIEVYYPPKDQRISHFNKLWDNVRISLLNTLLVSISLLKTHRSPRTTALAIGIGVWIGCTPFFGFHTLLVALIATLFRLNAVFLWLGTQISIPPIAPFLVLSSISLGTQINEVFNPQNPVAFNRYWSWLLGSLCLGGVLGVLFGFISYWVCLQLKQREKKQSSWNGKSRGGYFGNLFLSLVTRYLGLRTASLFLYGIVPYFYLFAPKARRSSQEYWSIVQPELGYFQKQRRVLGHLFKFAQVLLDRLFQSFSRERRFLPNPNGLENIKTAVESKNGIILLTAHVGAWDLASSFLEQDSLSSDFYVVHYSTGQTENATYQKSLLSNGAEQPIFQIRDLLDRGMPIALMGDRPLTRQFELVPFFGKLAPFDVTAFRIAAACQKPLLCTFGFKGKNNQYDFYAEKPQTFKYDSGKNKIVQCYEWTAQFAQVLERYLGQYPDQWFNFFPFWSYLPVSPMGLSTSKEHNYLLEELHKPRKRLPESESDSRPSDERGSLKKDMLKVD